MQIFYFASILDTVWSGRQVPTANWKRSWDTRKCSPTKIWPRHQTPNYPEQITCRLTQRSEVTESSISAAQFHNICPPTPRSWTIMGKSFGRCFFAAAAASSESKYLETTTFSDPFTRRGHFRLLWMPGVFPSKIISSCFSYEAHLDHAGLADGPIANDHHLHRQLDVLVPQVRDVHCYHFVTRIHTSELCLSQMGLISPSLSIKQPGKHELRRSLKACDLSEELFLPFSSFA